MEKNTKTKKELLAEIADLRRRHNYFPNLSGTIPANILLGHALSINNLQFTSYPSSKD